MSKRTVYFDTFLNYLDAMHWLEMHLMENSESNIIEAKLYYVNGAWSVSAMFGDPQLDLELDHG